ncbi:MAG TPA: hypothetical protein VG710_04855 [Opitutus sp.]|nr:hypothetical protein [Opitutus sp.]
MLAAALEIPARELMRHAEREWRAFRRRPRGATLRPGAETPLWLALAAAAKPHLGKRGARALLARELGLHQSRVREYFDTRTAMPDAERTLFLLLWLERQRHAPLPAAPRRNKTP